MNFPLKREITRILLLIKYNYIRMNRYYLNSLNYSAVRARSFSRGRHSAIAGHEIVAHFVLLCLLAITALSQHFGWI